MGIVSQLSCFHRGNDNLQYVVKMWRVLVTPIFCITYMIMKKYYPSEPVNINIQPLINTIQENNWVITTKKGKGKLLLFHGNGEQVIPFYGSNKQDIGRDSGSRGVV